MHSSRRRLVLASSTCLLLGSRAWAQAPQRPPELADTLPDARLRGKGRLRFLGLQVYDARLWTLDGFQPDTFQQHPLALELEYARELVGKRIAERSLVELKKVGDVPEAKAATWLVAMEAAFPDVKAGDRITGLHKPGEGIRFFVNGRPGAEIRDTDFARLFVSIWLSPRTSEPALRRSLLGIA